MQQQNLTNKALGGLKWSLIDNLANSGITFLVGIVLARLLSPTEFGILGLITIFINLFNTIVDGGFATALIRNPQSDEKDYNTVFYMNLLFSFVLMGVLCLCSPLLARFFSQPILAHIMPVMSILLVVNAFAIIPRTLLVKKVDFKTQAKISLIASIGSGVIGIGMALASFHIWSLVAQQLSRQILLTLFLWIYNSWRPQRIFSKERFRDLFGFGYKVLLANLMNSIYKDIFLVVVGKMYPAEQLGQYNRADQFNQICTTNLAGVIQKVTFPILSEVQHDKERFSMAFKKVLGYSSIVTFALVLGLAAVAKPLLMILVGEQWTPAVKYLQIMCLYGAIYPIQVLNVNILNIVKRSDLLLKLEIIKKLLFIFVIVTGFFFELEYMLWAAVIYYYIEFFFNSWYTERYTNFGTWKQIKYLLPLLFFSLCVTLCVACLTMTSLPYWAMMCLQIGGAIVLYVIGYELWKQQEYRELKQKIAFYLKRR